jgi:hypothetical protein
LVVGGLEWSVLKVEDGGEKWGVGGKEEEKWMRWIFGLKEESFGGRLESGRREEGKKGRREGDWQEFELWEGGRKERVGKTHLVKMPISAGEVEWSELV